MFAICCVLYIGNHTTYKISVSEYFFNLLQIFLNSSMPNFRKIVGKVKCLLITWIFCMVVNNTQFNCALTSMLVSSRSQEPIKTLEELSKSNLSILIHGYFVHRGYIPKSLGLSDKLIKLDEQPENLLNLTKENNLAFVIRIDAAKFYINIHRNKDGQSRHSILKESLIPGVDVYTLQKNSPLVKQFNRCLLLIKQHGLVKFPETRDIKARPNEHEVLNISHLWSVIGLYLLGNSLAILVLIGEVLWKKYKQ